jgi:hypothetical protein
MVDYNRSQIQLLPDKESLTTGWISDWSLASRIQSQNQSQSHSYVTTTISRPVSLGIRQPSGACDQIFITVWQLRVCSCGALSLTRGRVCHLQLLVGLASAVILGSGSRGTRDHILLSQILDFLFVASCDSQGYGGGIRPRLHTGYKASLKLCYDWRLIDQSILE